MQNVLPNSPLPKEENLPPPRDAPLYERLKWSHEFDEMSHRDVALGRRIGFYKIKSDLGSGNFSKVKLANHQLTKGRILITLSSKIFLIHLIKITFIQHVSILIERAKIKTSSYIHFEL